MLKIFSSLIFLHSFQSRSDHWRLLHTHTSSCLFNQITANDVNRHSLYDGARYIEVSNLLGDDHHLHLLLQLSSAWYIAFIIGGSVYCNNTKSSHLQHHLGLPGCRHSLSWSNGRRRWHGVVSCTHIHNGKQWTTKSSSRDQIFPTGHCLSQSLIWSTQNVHKSKTYFFLCPLFNCTSFFCCLVRLWSKGKTIHWLRERRQPNISPCFLYHDHFRFLHFQNSRYKIIIHRSSLSTLNTQIFWRDFSSASILFLSNRRAHF